MKILIFCALRMFRGTYNMDENGDDRYCGKCFIGKINSYEVYIKEDVV